MKIELEVKREIVFLDVLVFIDGSFPECGRCSHLTQFIFAVTDNFKNEIGSVLGAAVLKKRGNKILANIAIPIGVFKNIPYSFKDFLNCTPAVGGEIDKNVKDVFQISQVALCFGNANADKRIPTLKNYRIEVL